MEPNRRKRETGKTSGDRRSEPLLGALWWPLLVFVGAWAFLKYAFPYLAQRIIDSPHPLPVPGVARAMYLILVLVGIGVYAFSTDPIMRRFLRPLALLLRGEGGPAVGVVRWAVLAGAPVLVAYAVFTQLAPSAAPPTEARLQHPTIPRKYERLENPFRNPKDDEVRKFLSDAGLTGMGLEEGRRLLVRRHVMEGVDLYQKNCRPCHGTKTDGDGPMARGFRLRPVNFTDTGTIATLVEAYLFWRVKEGGIALPNEASPWDSAMPAWGCAPGKTDDPPGCLTDEQIWKIILAEYATAGVSPRTREQQE